ncbi:MAG TPA: efflux RND transporter periplasmic adaptor subunit [Gemmatimonadales bacterium]
MSTFHYRRRSHPRGATRVTVPVVLIVVLIVGSACSQGGADTATDAEAGAETPRAGGVITLWTDSTELFMEHPALIVGAPDKFAVHLTDVTDFTPLREGVVTMRFVPRDGGAPVEVTQETPRAPGIYGPAPEFTRAGVYDLSILVNSPQARDSIFVPDLRVYATASEAPPELEEGETGIAFLKEQQWKTPGFRMTRADSGEVVTTVRVSGTIEPAAGRYAAVTAPVSGLVDAGGVAGSPAPGQRVGRNQTLAVLTPALGEGGSVYAAARAELAEAEDEHARATRLYAAEAVPERRVHEARIRLTAAREAVAGLGGAATSGGQLVVRSPIAGVVASRNIAPGGRVDAGTALFTVVDPSVVWLTARVPAADAMRVGRGATATFRIDGSDRVYEAARMVSMGSVIDDVTRTMPVIYEVRNGDGSIPVGATAQVDVRTGARQSGVVIPSSAVLDEDGQPVAYVQLHGEAFEKRVLTVGGAEGGRTLVLSGIQPGEYVVSGAAYQVRLASMSTAVPAEGHAH